jgi:hypothetical protein
VAVFPQIVDLGKNRTGPQLPICSPPVLPTVGGEKVAGEKVAGGKRGITVGDLKRG